jgi:predicted nucleic acid-binding protein
MVHKLFLDTNIIIDFVEERLNEFNAIKEIIHLAELQKVELFISESVITTAFYVLQKHKIEALPVLREICKIINTVSFSKDILYRRWPFIFFSG